MPRKAVGDKPMSDAERQARRQAKLITFRPTDKGSIEAAAQAEGLTAAALVARIMDSWITGGALPPSPPPTPEEIAGAEALDTQRRAILADLAAVLARAAPGQVQRIADRIDAIRAIVG